MSFQDEAYHIAKQLRNFMARYNIFYNEDLIKAVDALEDLKEIDNKISEEKYFLKVVDASWFFDKDSNLREIKLDTPEEVQKQLLSTAWLFNTKEDAEIAIKEMKLKNIIGMVDLEPIKISEFEIMR